MWALINKYVIGAGILAAVLMVTWSYGARQHSIGYAKAQTEYKLLAAQAEQAVRDEDRRRIEEIENVKKQAQTEVDDIRANADRANADAGRLRSELARVRQLAINATASNGNEGQPGASTINLLAELLDRMEQDGRDIAQYADRLKVAGIGCEQSYDALRR